MATRLAAIGSLVALFLSACTNAAKPRDVRSGLPGFTQVSHATKVAELQFFQQDTTILSMGIRQNQLHMTGRPHAYAAVDIMTDPELSDTQGRYKLFVAAENLDLFSPDPPFGGWVVDYYGSGGMAFFNRFSFLSGIAGMSVLDLNNARQPVEVARFPPLNSDGEPVQDLAFVYKAIIPHPTQPILFGFSEQDYIYNIDVSQAPQARITSRTPYSSSGTVCCVTGATVFNGRVYVAMRGSLRVMDFTADGRLVTVGETNMLQAANVVSTSSYLYVHHESLSGSSSSRTPGIYVIDRAGRQIDYLPIRPNVFAVHPNNTHLYSNENDLVMNIYRLALGAQ